LIVCGGGGAFVPAARRIAVEAAIANGL
jgi:hypothetical protein